MSIIPSPNPLIAAPKHPTIFNRSPLPPHLTPKISLPRIKQRARTGLRREIPRLLCTNPTERSNQTSTDEEAEGKDKSMFRSWDVPWDWKVTTFVMMPYLMSIVLAGYVESAGLAGGLRPYSKEMLAQLPTTDEVAIKMCIDQLLKSVAKLSIAFMFVSPYRPFPDDIFTLRWGKPFNTQNGWILWAVGGLLFASVAVFLVKAFVSGSGAGQTPNETESLVRLLPLIGSSNVSTVCLLGILGILAPVCEETLYRGFFLTSLTKWFSLPLSVLLSSAVFALAHQSPGKFIDIFVFGITLGLVYAQTRNLLAPIAMHACWNSGTILVLTYLHSQGHDIQKYIL